jgi:hypothetical protein
MVGRIRTVRILTTQNKLMTHHHHHHHLFMHEMVRMVRTVAMMKNKMMAVVVMWKL